MTQSGEREFNRGKLARLEKWVTCYLSKQVWKTVFLLIWECDGISRGERLTENQFGKLWFWGVFGGPKTSEPGCKCCSVGFWDLRLTATAPPRDQKVRAGFRSTPSQVCTCVYMYICIYVHMYICIYVYMYICINANMYICIYVQM